ncbi:MAG TPA: zinc ribbon domain-containing protein [Terriglobia bacterium]|nr:zinc ribbon domain-containing protein [Terriglobia bacterium]
MQCPKCKTENTEQVVYCVRCHTPLKYTCPACKHVQLQGGQCEKCGVDFAKYAAMLIFQAQEASQQKRKRTGWRPPIWVHIVFFPFPAIIQLVLYLVRKARSR